MNEQISWDPSLVKKFSSSNHFKLLNQLRSEVIKYPLNRKKNFTTNVKNEIQLTNKNKSNETDSVHNSIPQTTIINNENSSNQINVSFNNSKNFSIYNKKNDINNQYLETSTFEGKGIKDQQSQSSFKDRLDQIDMK